MTGAVLITHDDDIITWTLNRPEADNPISEPDVIEALRNAGAPVGRVAVNPPRDLRTTKKLRQEGRRPNCTDQ
ncbi:hypothetical protein [Rhodococcus marinonascens]|uniref:hypothetical protein n=1 Tax=Rhodococcus marinonascens TaxID=38311 RepID=UPI0009354EA9|nr:hypothetical protein [Rhodococcus marinonascens]